MLKACSHLSKVCISLWQNAGPGLQAVASFLFSNLTYRERNGLNCQALHNGIISLHVQYHTGVIVAFFLKLLKVIEPQTL